MDPNKALREIRKLLRVYWHKGLSDGETGKLFELVEALDEWLAKGGFLPKDWERRD